MKNNLKKILSLVLVAVMCLSLVPFSVFAEETVAVECTYCQGTNTVWKKYTTATCSINWSGDTYVCQDCKNWTAASTKGTAAGHAEQGIFVIVDADAPAHVPDLELKEAGYAKTCVSNGMTDKYLCLACNEYVGGTVIPAGHDWAAVEGKTPAADGWCTIVAPICGVRGGTYKRYCPTCELSETKETAMVDHVWDYDGSKKAPTVNGVDCNEDNAAGTIKFYCENNGCSEYTTVKVNDCEHTWSRYVTVKEATCSEVGKKTRVCYGCGDTEDIEIDTIAHTFKAGTAVAAVAGTCTSAGTVAYDICTVCNNKVGTEGALAGKILTDITVKLTMPDGTASADNFAHVWGTVTNVAATCGDYAYKSWKCTNVLCNAVYTIVNEDVELKAHVETLTYTPATVTCYADGNVAYYSCSACNKKFSDAAGLNEITTIAAEKLNHKNAVWVDRVEATCAAAGKMGHYYCPDCNEEYKDKNCAVVYPDAELVIARVTDRHTGTAKWYKTVNRVEVETTVDAEEAAATCQPVVLTKHCDCCNTPFDTVTIVDTVEGHNYINKTTELYQIENCVEGKYAWYYWDCEYCDAKKAFAETEFKHKFDGSIYRDSVAENCTETIVRTIWCAVEGCEVTTTKNIGIGAHSVKAVAAKAATCTANGYIAHYACELCDAKFSDAAATTPITTEEALIGANTIANHQASATFSLIHKVKAVGCTTFGYELNECDLCGYVEANALKVKGHIQTIKLKVDATCDNDGYYEYSYCTRRIKVGSTITTCGAVIVVDKVVIPATGHKNKDGQTLTYDCVSDANIAITDRVCVNPWCNDADKIIDFAHDLIPVSGGGNCVEDKYTAMVCTKCYRLYNRSETAGTKDPTNHKAADVDHAETLKADNSHCQNAGTKVYTCGWCEGDIVRNVAAQNKNHTSIKDGTKVLPRDNMTDTQKTKAARYFTVTTVEMTATSKGYTRYTCKWCDWYKDVDVQDPYTIWFSFDYDSANKNATGSHVVNGGMVEVKLYARALDKVATNIQATFNYDPEVLTFVDAQGEDIFDQAFITGKDGLVTIFAFNDDIANSEINGTMLLATLKFKVATLDTEDELGWNAGRKYITTNFTNFAAEATVADPDVDNEGTPLTCLLDDLAGSTNDDTIDIHKLGAISSDNWITGLDHVELYKLIASKGIVDGKLVAEADVDMDGDVDVDDYIFLAQYLGNELTYAELVELVSRPVVKA